MPLKDTAAGNMHKLIQIVMVDLTHFLSKHLPKLSSDWWQHNVIDRLTYQQQKVAQDRGFTRLEHLDFAALLCVLDRNWFNLKQHPNLSREGLNWVKELQSIRNKWAHLSLQEVEAEEIYRDADTMGRVLKELDAPRSSIDAIEKVKSNAMSKMVSSRKIANGVQQASTNTAEPKQADSISNHPLPTGLRTMHICDQAVSSARYLEAHGLTQQQLTTMHHRSLQGKEETFRATYKYFGDHKNLRSRNRNYTNRLVFVATGYQRAEGNFTQLIRQAMDKWPLV